MMLRRHAARRSGNQTTSADLDLSAPNGYDALDKPALVALLVERGLAKSGNMPALRARLVEADAADASKPAEPTEPPVQPDAATAPVIGPEAAPTDEATLDALADLATEPDAEPDAEPADEPAEGDAA